MTDQDAKEYVNKLKGFYRTSFAYFILNLLTILVWLLIEEEYFWPGWILLISCLYLINQAITLNLIPYLNEFSESFLGLFPGVSKEWEEKKIKKLVNSETPSSSGPKDGL